MEAGVLHPNQSAYRKQMSRADTCDLCHPRGDQPLSPRGQKGVHVFVQSTKHLQFSGTNCAIEEVVWHGSKLQDMAHIAQLVHRLTAGVPYA